MRTVINIKAEKDVKEKAQKTAKELGLSLSALINAYLRQFVRTKTANFSLAFQVSPELEKLLGGTEFDILRKKNISKAITCQKELRDYLSSL